MKANTAFQKKYDRDSAYKDFMLDLTKQMNAELDDWFRQNKLSNKANIDDARRTLDDMQRSFASGNEKEAFAHFDTLAEKMGMRVNGRWYERPLTDLDQLRQEQDASTDARDTRVERARAQKTIREGQQQ